MFFPVLITCNKSVVISLSLKSLKLSFITEKKRESNLP